jgi:hypothetical protein
MASYWDRTDKRRRLIEERQRDLADMQMQLWGWCDQRLRDGFGRLLKPKSGKRGGRTPADPGPMQDFRDRTKTVT